jgi:tetratricopeptide (TPR) repeat protein
MFWKEGMAKPDYKKLIQEIIPLDEEIKKYPSSEARSMSAVTHYMLGVNYLELKDSWARDSAKIEFQKSAALAGDMKGIHIMLADNFLGLHDYKDALTSAQTALQKRPDSAKSYFIIGNCYEEKKDFQKAIQSFNSVLQMDPKYADSVKIKERIEALKKKIH